MSYHPRVDGPSEVGTDDEGVDEIDASNAAVAGHLQLAQNQHYLPGYPANHGHGASGSNPGKMQTFHTAHQDIMEGLMQGPSQRRRHTEHQTLLSRQLGDKNLRPHSVHEADRRRQLSVGGASNLFDSGFGEMSMGSQSISNASATSLSPPNSLSSIPKPLSRHIGHGDSSGYSSAEQSGRCHSLNITARKPNLVAAHTRLLQEEKLQRQAEVDGRPAAGTSLLSDRGDNCGDEAGTISPNLWPHQVRSTDSSTNDPAEIYHQHQSANRSSRTTDILHLRSNQPSPQISAISPAAVLTANNKPPALATPINCQPPGTTEDVDQLLLPQGLASTPGGYNAIFDPPLESKHKCLICKKALRDPVQTECGHRFCKECVERIKSSSSGPLICPLESCREILTGLYPDNFCRREVLNLRVKCSNFSSGCQWTGQLRDLEGHLPSCLHGLIPCPHRQRGCSEMLLRPDVEKHVKDRCQFRNHICPYCQETLIFAVLQKHIDEDCLEFVVLCPEGCGQSFKRSDVENHLLQHCTMVERFCPLGNLGCQVKGKQSDLEKHMHDPDSVFRHMGIMAEHVVSNSKQLKPVMQTVDNHAQRLDKLEKELQAERNAHERTKACLLSTETQLADLAKQMQAIQVRFEDMSAQMPTVSKPGEHVGAFEERLTAVERTVIQAEASATTAKQNVETNRLQVAGIERQVASFNQIIGRTDAIMAEFDLRLLSQETCSYNGTLVWKIPDFNRHFEDARSGRKPSLYSPPFYSSRHGYKMCARVYLNGDGTGKNTHMSIFFVVMRGEFDALLQWPFHQKVTLTLLDQSTHRSNVSDTFQPDPRSSSFQRPISEMNIASGCPRFVPHETLRSSNYLKNNTIFIRVSIDTAGLPLY